MPGPLRQRGGTVLCPGPCRPQAMYGASRFQQLWPWDPGVPIPTWCPLPCSTGRLSPPGILLSGEPGSHAPRRGQQPGGKAQSQGEAAPGHHVLWKGWRACSRSGPEAAHRGPVHGQSVAYRGQQRPLHGAPCGQGSQLPCCCPLLWPMSKAGVHSEVTSVSVTPSPALSSSQTPCGVFLLPRFQT